ncbi:MAG: sulfurase [Rhizobacter sp.]|nr:sulfurase [Rhizobacter sp.]
MGWISSVNVALATAMQIGDRPVMTAIAKRPIAGHVGVQALGLAGDEQADLSVHGGLPKAVYGYPAEHLDFWRTVRAQAKVSGWEEAISPGLLGENLTMHGLLEKDAFIGDVLRFPNCTLAISEPRYPCFKFNAAMGFNQASKLMVQSAWCGYYLAVRKPGTIAAGEEFELIPGPRDVGITELFRSRTSRQKG